jgi:hypothetical protein
MQFFSLNLNPNILDIFYSILIFLFMGLSKKLRGRCLQEKVYFVDLVKKLA